MEIFLYGFPTGRWEVNLPAEEVTPDLPEHALGINFARDGMQVKDWLAFVAVHSDAWLLSVAFYFGARFAFEKADRCILRSNSECQCWKLHTRMTESLKVKSYSRLFINLQLMLYLDRLKIGLIWRLLELLQNEFHALKTLIIVL